MQLEVSYLKKTIFGFSLISPEYYNIFPKIFYFSKWLKKMGLKKVKILQPLKKIFLNF